MKVAAGQIRANQPGEFRTGFFYEDIVDGATWGEAAEVTTPTGTIEKVLILDQVPIKIPYMQVYYARKIKGIKDPFIAEVLRDFMFFNEGIDQAGISKLVSFIVRYLCLPAAGITYETLYPVAYEMIPHLPDPELLYDQVILFQRGSLLPAKERKSMSLQVRGMRNSYLFGEIIHNATLAAIDKSHPKLKITKFKVLEETASSGREIKSVKTLNVHIKEETEHVLDVANSHRHFTTGKSLNKYKKFLALPPMSVRDMSATLGVSKSTVMKYREVHDQE